jgi:hypothetical protein
LHSERARNSSLKTSRDRLACLALQEIFGIDNVDTLFGGDDDDDDDELDFETSDGSVSVKVRLGVISILKELYLYWLIKRYYLL